MTGTDGRLVARLFLCGFLYSATCFLYLPLFAISPFPIHSHVTGTYSYTSSGSELRMFWIGLIPHVMLCSAAHIKHLHFCRYSAFIHSMTDEDARFFSGSLLCLSLQECIPGSIPSALPGWEVTAEVGTKTGNEKGTFDMYCISCCRLHEAVYIAGIVNVKLKQAESQACDGVFHGFLARLWSSWHEEFIFILQVPSPVDPSRRLRERR
jgi:hypothetical protein